MASAAVQNKTPRKVLKKSTRDSLIAYSFIAPNFIGFCVFTLVPWCLPLRWLSAHGTAATPSSLSV